MSGVDDCIGLLWREAFTYFTLADQNDPDYAPPIWAVSSMVAAWMVFAGLATVVLALVSQALGEGAQFWLGFATFAFGILKLAALEFAALETWRIARATTISFDLVAATALVLGAALMLTSGALAGRRLGRERSPDT